MIFSSKRVFNAFVTFEPNNREGNLYQTVSQHKLGFETNANSFPLELAKTPINDFAHILKQQQPIGTLPSTK